MFFLCIGSTIIAGCGGDDNNNSQQSMPEQNPTPKMEFAYNTTKDVIPVAKKYQECLRRYLTIRKNRENLSYSVAAKVGEEMVTFRSLAKDVQEKRLKDLEQQLEDYE